MRRLFVALQFLTILPVPYPREWDERDLGRSMALFPLAGLALGLLLAAADRLLAMALPGGITALLLVVLLTVATGALHLDGLADVADGVAARGGRERFLAVMKDSCTGPVGAAAVCLSLLLKYQGILHLPADLRTSGLFILPALGRYVQVVMTVGSRRARNDGLGALFAGSAGRGELAVAAATAAVASWLLLHLPGIALFGAVSALGLLLRLWFHLRLGGITGDTVGCASELAEILVLILLAAAAGS